ncbi:DUF1311 domain-containing protein [Roseovarius sp. SCSIO 43702]|uniref:lysozyme inhibitor LprI family protein n=1 Tax=Roseovarius sp. SCSIO 43702 TaxID=2823043 RepID=UPI001C73557A|nr:lysozyme inhibitor LprI family protein [Roseovarius sp. SCSIO 43702]QYX55640.1 DUF1311 domain-containing protein [Roseovarius sp. SCSIO 43702]
MSDALIEARSGVARLARGFLGPICLGGLLVVASGPAVAQQVTIAPGLITQCLYDKPVERYPECIGIAAEQCMKARGYATAVMGGCAHAEYEYWDQRLNVAYKAARAKAKRMDTANEELVRGSLVTALRDMQRAWIAYRDATCDFERLQWGGGTGGGPATASCLMRETAEQFFDLDAFASY